MWAEEPYVDSIRFAKDGVEDADVDYPRNYDTDKYRRAQRFREESIMPVTLSSCSKDVKERGFEHFEFDERT